MIPGGIKQFLHLSHLLTSSSIVDEFAEEINSVFNQN